MTFIRDFLRRRRVARHVAAHGYQFAFHGITVRIPEDSPPGVGNALLKQKYEREEADLIQRHLPPDIPVVELGGSIGVVSALVRSRLARGVKHVIVEANPALVDICRENAERGDASATEVVNAALGYGATVLRFALGDNIHANHLVTEGQSAKQVIEVQAITLSELVNRVDPDGDFSLVCDIEGGELDMVRNEGEVIGRAAVVIMELHPKAYPGGDADDASIGEVMRGIGFELVERINDVCMWRRGRNRYPDAVSR
jgi:FkbM family methyltransferase